MPKLGIDNENGAVCGRNRILATNSPKLGSSAESSFDTLQGQTAIFVALHASELRTVLCASFSSGGPAM